MTFLNDCLNKVDPYLYIYFNGPVYLREISFSVWNIWLDCRYVRM